MRLQRSRSIALLCSLTLLLVLAPLAPAQQRGRGGLYGDWELTVDYDGRQMTSILSFTRDSEGKRKAALISFWGLTELENFQNEEGKVSFSYTRPGRDGQARTSTFSGTLAEGKLTGAFTSDRGTYSATGKRSPRVPRAAGTWTMTLQMGDQELTPTLTVKSHAEGGLTAEWKSEWGKPEISDVTYSRGKLAFKMQSTGPEHAWEAQFTGTVEGSKLTGKLTSERGEIEANGVLEGAPAIGTWNLEVTSDRGTRKQRLRINADMTGLWGATPIKEIKLEGDNVDFTTALEFGDQRYEMKFTGTLSEAKLTGTLTTPRGSSQITGTKVTRSRPRNRG